MTTNPLLLLQMWPAGCYGKIAMGTGPQEALVGMQKTFSVFVWSSCIQPSDFGFEIIKLNQRKLWLFCFRNFWKFPAPEHQHGGWCDLPGKDQSFSQNEWIALHFLKGEVWIMWCLNLSLWLHALFFFIIYRKSATFLLVPPTFLPPLHSCPLHLLCVGAYIAVEGKIREVICPTTYSNKKIN